ncbi:heavy-metal-associated domain-containing protein [Salicibibacter kimchii]|uniref:Heavy-metal-associated domain-containing protein n=1 Tax=Salicibibacter kimchii TaxID=2099786 RepID=A0A345BW07_9BACI|nr:heavy-metal-associated domain-containing protein [Salicibibacter kimchii]
MKKGLSKLDGVEKADVNLALEKINVRFNPMRTLAWH